jgi:type VI secretion system secreted protein Hcp
MPIYLQYDSGKVKGDVTAAGHEKWIEVSSFSWSVGRNIRVKPGKVSDREAAAPSISEVTITKTLDDATPLLLQEALSGEGVHTQIDFCKTDGKELEVYASYLLENCMLSGYSVSSGGERPEESLTLNFTAIECQVVPASAAGSDGKMNRVMYDLATAKT